MITIRFLDLRLYMYCLEPNFLLQKNTNSRSDVQDSDCGREHPDGVLPVEQHAHVTPVGTLNQANQSTVTNRMHGRKPDEQQFVQLSKRS